MPSRNSKPARRKLGFAHWMRRVPARVVEAAAGLTPDVVHDLRVAIRRCRSMADGLMTMDPDPTWPEMRRAGKKLFRRLGDLRDVQVMLHWIEQLAPPEDVLGRNLRDALLLREAVLKEKAAAAVLRFDRQRWKAWGRHLASRAERIPLDSLAYQHLALERWHDARALHRRALRDRSQAGWHALRIGIKRFRYTVENFLPTSHHAWGEDLKRLQDLLGEVHDFDVLAAALAERTEPHSTAELTRWREVLDRERNKRLEEYRSNMLGRRSLWRVWRAGLPAGDALLQAALEKIAYWSEFRDPEFDRSRRIAQLALELFDGLATLNLPGPYRDPRARFLLHAAALMHNVARARGARGHHKAAYREIRKMTPPLGWTAEELEVAALVARYHRGATPTTDHRGFAALGPSQRDMVLHLSGILRLAAAFDFDRSGAVRHVMVSSQANGVQVTAQGYTAREDHARVLTAERHLLERALRRPILIRPRAVGPKKIPPRVPLAAVVA